MTVTDFTNKILKTSSRYWHQRGFTICMGRRYLMDFDTITIISDLKILLELKVGRPKSEPVCKRNLRHNPSCLHGAYCNVESEAMTSI